MTNTYLLDTNVLLRIAQRNHPLHLRTRAALRQLRAANATAVITTQNAIEFWNVATRPADRNGFGLTPVTAAVLLRRIERVVALLDDSPLVYPAWRQVVTTFGVSGVQVHDARLVASMQVYGISHILTYNTADFSRYASLGIQAHAPSILL